MPAYLGMWGLFTLVLFIGTQRLNRALQVVFGSLTALFFLLAITDATGIGAIGKTAGWVGLFCGVRRVCGYGKAAERGLREDRVAAGPCGARIGIGPGIPERAEAEDGSSARFRRQTNPIVLW